MTTMATGGFSDTQLLAEGRHHNPHAFLGLHETPQGQVIRLWRPRVEQVAERIHLEVLGEIAEAARVDERGLFAYSPKRKIGFSDYRVYQQNGLLAHDPYAFWPGIGEMDAFLFNKGCHYELYAMLGANVKRLQGVQGVQFAVWAPNARGVSLVADFNRWDGRLCPMRSMGASGVWELFVPGLKEGEKYKFEIQAREGYVRIKSDPVAFYSELRPKTASVVFDVNAFAWNDAVWMAERARQSLNRPMNIYEVHLGSWRYFGTEFPNYRQIAAELAAYCKEMGFSHVELLPVMEHPLDESWGYQVTGFFAATSRYGNPADFQFFVDHMHQNGIGVILDWVPAHFPTDDYSLNRFDGTALYEHEDPRKGIHPHWQTAIFNYGRKEVSNFLLASALFWLDKMHVDGLRVDAVASMLYLDYGRKAGEWVPNPDGSNYNTEAIEFLKHLNVAVHERFPGVLMIAEESSSYGGVTRSPEENGLGFDLKWNMGWMNDTLRYISRDPIYRKFHQNELTFSLLYAYSERFLSVLSHDEVVHGKGSLLQKMPGPEWQKFAGLRLLYGYLMTHPGKKLFFMGGEIAQWSEWDCKGHLAWNSLASSYHRGMQEMVRDLNFLYHRSPALWERDFDWQGYDWIDFADAEKSVISYLRKGQNKSLACVLNFTPEFVADYRLRLKNVKKIREVFNTDDVRYGGSGQINSQIAVFPEEIAISLAPLAAMLFEVEL